MTGVDGANLRFIPLKRTERERTVRHSIAFVLVLAALAGFADRVQAGGLMLYELGTRDVGLAGAGWAARPDDAATLFRNPAGMHELPGNQLLFGAQLLYGDLGFEPNALTSESGSNGGNPIGALPGGSAFFTHTWAVGVGVFSYFGGVVSYDGDWVGRYLIQEATLAGITIMPAVSYRVHERFSVGLGLNGMVGVLREQAAINTLGQGPEGQIEVEDTTPGFGVNIGLLFEAMPGVRIGLDYLSEVSLGFESGQALSGSGAFLDRLRGRVGESQLDLDLNVPQSLMLSLHNEINPTVAVMANLGWQNWDRFGKVGVAMFDTLGTTTIDRNYEDVWHGAAGLEWQAKPEWQFTTGFAYDSSMVEDLERTVDLPVGEAYRIAVGSIWQAKESLQVGLAYELAWTGISSSTSRAAHLSAASRGHSNPPHCTSWRRI